MQYIDRIDIREDADYTPSEGPIFLYSDSESEHLIYARAVWGLEELGGVPAASPQLVTTESPASPTERQRLAQIWVAAWDSVWAMYSAALDDSVLAAEIPEPLDWKSLAAPSTLTAEGLVEWRMRIMTPEPLGSRYPDIARAAEEAFGRGLACVYVLPMDGEWALSVRGRILLISSQTHDSSEALQKALTGF
ncbi:hypothetical protein RCH23_001955 [Cryobacterium sp. CAN_C3]|uniref:hypothetical protein n=1 Tax=unclassified Cryobacterium TaxID=2649013 RepID=UPI0018CBC30B|nr:hypothetical protein [Cryobacterium sp. CAN_C3]MEC5154571.1 hypothetical protein [Cryobacterium sp. CAN_C3]